MIELKLRRSVRKGNQFCQMYDKGFWFLRRYRHTYEWATGSVEVKRQDEKIQDEKEVERKGIVLMKESVSGTWEYLVETKGFLVDSAIFLILEILVRLYLTLRPEE